MIEENPIRKLADAIVLQAVEDYRLALGGKAVRGESPERVINDVEKFFRSDWFYMLTLLDGEILIKKLRKEVAQKG